MSVLEAIFNGWLCFWLERPEFDFQMVNNFCGRLHFNYCLICLANLWLVHAMQFIVI